MAFFNNLSVKKLSETPDTDFVLQKGFLYGNSKLGLLIVSDIFAEKLKGTGVTSNSVHPGVVATSIWAKSFLIYKNIIYRIAVEVGAPIIAKVSRVLSVPNSHLLCYKNSLSFIRGTVLLREMQLVLIGLVLNETYFASILGSLGRFPNFSARGGC